MKHANACPKCHAIDIVRVPGRAGAYGSGNNIVLKTLALSASAYVLVTRYVCGACGYSEEWIDTKEDIEKIKNKFAS